MLLAALAVVPLAVAVPASAAPVPTCAPSAAVFGVEENGDLFTYPHNEPETGLASWGAKRVIGTGWNAGNTLAGPNGVFYSVRATGQLLRYRWNGVGWDSQNGSQSRAIPGEYWAELAQPGNRNRITIDSTGTIFALTPFGLRAWNYEKDLPEGRQGALIGDATGESYDHIVATGEGVFYTVAHWDGSLYRFHYDVTTNRWLQYAQKVGTGWGIFSRLFSAGGDTIYAVAPSNNPDLLWYHYDSASGKWANSGAAKAIGTGWRSLREVRADPAKCAAPERPAPPARVSLPMPSGQRPTLRLNTREEFAVARVDDNGHVLVGTQNPPGSDQISWTSSHSAARPLTGAVSIGSNASGALLVSALDIDGTVRQVVIPAAPKPATAVNQGGPFTAVVSPARSRFSGEAAGGTSFAVDGEGVLWTARQHPDGRNEPWLSTGVQVGTDFTISDTPASENSSIVAYRTPTGEVEVRRFVPGVGLTAARKAPGFLVVGAPQIAATSGSTYRVHLTARGVDGTIRTQVETPTGFAGWTDISGGRTFTGEPVTVATRAGLLEVFARTAGDVVVRTGEVSTPTGYTWRPWQTGVGTSVVDPRVALSESGTMRVLLVSATGKYTLPALPALPPLPR
ncbi:Tachylectin [Actinokineospora diospyrosa]|uniref:Tachylectin n=1 Tax=Actinokineospora diospyrosa TaxID=103728 RepID=A0ABT1I6I7_9PSEU|nr:Tachylectin [Actinokineospora diospyrosa]